VLVNFLKLTETETQCPYKGIAETFGVRAAGEFYSDFAWSYPEPLAACSAIQSRICFYNEVVDIREDGKLLPRPDTHFK